MTRKALRPNSNILEKNENDTCIVDKWEFFYQGQKGDTSRETLKSVEDSTEGRKGIFYDAVVDPTAIDDELVKTVEDGIFAREGIGNNNLFQKSRMGFLDTDVPGKLA